VDDISISGEEPGFVGAMVAGVSFPDARVVLAAGTMFSGAAAAAGAGAGAGAGAVVAEALLPAAEFEAIGAVVGAIALPRGVGLTAVIFGALMG
jgi:hypothetical protein